MLAHTTNGFLSCDLRRVSWTRLVDQRCVGISCLAYASNPAFSPRQARIHCCPTILRLLWRKGGFLASSHNPFFGLRCVSVGSFCVGMELSPRSTRPTKLYDALPSSLPNPLHPPMSNTHRLAYRVPRLRQLADPMPRLHPLADPMP